MTGSRAPKHKSHAHWDRGRHTEWGSAFQLQVHINFSVNQRQTLTCLPRLQDGAPFHLSARPGASACFKGNLRQWHQKVYTREVSHLVFSQRGKLRSLTGPTEGNISHLKHTSQSRKLQGASEATEGNTNSSCCTPLAKPLGKTKGAL